MKVELRFEVIVGNIGTVYDGASRKDANTTFNVYVELSQRQTGRAAGENVTMLIDGDIVKEFDGKLGKRV
jgi:hypothetical protein